MAGAASSNARRISLPGVLFALAILTTLPVIWTVVLPVLSGAARPGHAGHWLLVVLHVFTGLITLIAGTVGLYIGWTRRGFEWHRHVGCTYLGAGLTMAPTALILSFQAPHPVKSLFVSTGVLSLVWTLVACMGWRAGHNWREASHRDWMIRSLRADLDVRVLPPRAEPLRVRVPQPRRHHDGYLAVLDRAADRLRDRAAMAARRAAQRLSANPAHIPASTSVDRK